MCFCICEELPKQTCSEVVLKKYKLVFRGNRNTQLTSDQTELLDLNFRFCIFVYSRRAYEFIMGRVQHVIKGRKRPQGAACFFSFLFCTQLTMGGQDGCSKVRL